MQKNVASQQFVVFAFDATTNLPKTGDAANITATISKDFAADVATNDVNPTETQKGFYVFDATQAETNADDIQIFPSSVTANIQVISVPGLITTVPVSFGDDAIQSVDNNILAAGAAGFAAIDTVVDAIKLVTDKFAFTVANQVDANAIAISGDTTAADNLELQYDTTGLTGDSFPATQAQVGAIPTSGTGALNIEISADNASVAIKGVTKVGTETGTFANVEADDGVYHVITHAANVIDWVYQSDITGGRTAANITFKGYLTSANDSITVQAYDFIGATWDNRGVIAGQGGTVNINQTISLLSKHTGTSGADVGLVNIRFTTTGTSPVLNVDELLVEAINIGQSVGYAAGRVWINTVSGTAGTVGFVNGVADNKVDTLADALTIATEVGLAAFNVDPGSNITLAGATNNKCFYGQLWSLALGSQDIGDSHFEGADVSGIASSTGSDTEFRECEIGTCTLPPHHQKNCTWTTTVTAQAAGDFIFEDCSSQVAGSSSPTFDLAAVGATTASFRRWSGGLTLVNVATGDVISVDVVSGGTISINGSGGSVSVRGMCNVSDLSGGAVTIVQTNAITNTSIENAVWDAELTGTSHNNAQSAGRKLRTQADIILRSDMAQGSGIGNNQIQFDVGASAVDGAYDPAVVAIITGTGEGQTRQILDYVGATKTATVDRNWKVNPDATSEFNIYADAGREHVNEGLSQGGGASTITLNALASAIDDVYVGQICFIRSGTGDDQAGTIIAYNGTTKVATIDRTWGTTPDTTSAYVMLPASPVVLAATTHTGAIIPTVTNVTNDVGITQVGADKVWTSASRTLTGTVNVNVATINGVTVIGAGTSGNLWRA